MLYREFIYVVKNGDEFTSPDNEWDYSEELLTALMEKKIGISYSKFKRRITKGILEEAISWVFEDFKWKEWEEDSDDFDWENDPEPEFYISIFLGKPVYMMEINCEYAVFFQEQDIGSWLLDIASNDKTSDRVLLIISSLVEYAPSEILEELYKIQIMDEEVVV